MPVNEKILFRSFQYLFSLKSINYSILSPAMLRENHTVFWGKNIDFRGGGGINIRFRPKYRPLYGGVRDRPGSVGANYNTSDLGVRLLLPEEKERKGKFFKARYIFILPILSYLAVASAIWQPCHQ
jgi:hypothetical protein